MREIFILKFLLVSRCVDHALLNAEELYGKTGG